MGWWKEALRTRTTDWLFTRLGPDDGVAIEPESAYLNIFLSSMHIVNVREGLSRFYGAVSSYSALPHRRGGKAEFIVVTTPTHLKDVASKSIDRLLALNTRLLGPVPYRGGDVELQVGLFSIKAAELSGPYLELLENMAAAGGLSLIGPAMAFVTPLRRGLELLVGGNDPSVLEIGLSTTMNPPVTGTYCLVGAGSSKVDKLQLELGPRGQLVLDGRPLTTVPYLVVSIQASPQRDDWFQIPALRRAHEELVREVAAGSVARVDEAMAVFRRESVMSPDLLARDGARLADRAAEEVMLALGPRATGTDLRTIGPLESLRLYDASS